MAKERPFLASLNGGEVSPLSLGRIDLARMRYTAEEMTNFIPRVIGPMALRPGLGYLGTLAGQIKQIPFVFSAEDTAMIELGNQSMQVVVDDAVITRAAVATTITNGDFSSAVGWTLTNTGGSLAEPRSEIAGGVLTMNNWVRGGTMIVKRSTTVAAPDLNVEHGLRIVVTRGPVKFRCGSSDGGDEYIRETSLNTGTYSLAFTPTVSPFWVQFSSEVERDTIVDSIQIEGAGVMTLPTPWPTANLRQCRHEQSGDVIFVANSSRLYQTRRIERRAARSWGIALHENLDGPFKLKTVDLSFNFVIPPAVSGGPLTMNASKPYFRPEHVGGLFRLFAARQVVVNEIAAADKWTDSIRVSGIGTVERGITATITGTWAGTISAQISYDDELTWIDTGNTFVGNGTTGGLVWGADNQVVHIRFGFKPGNYTSGTARIALQYEGGGGWGVLRVVSYVSPTQVTVDVIKPPLAYMAGVFAEWEEGKFSDVNGWPSCLGFFDGRLWLGDSDEIMGSVSDAFNSLDVETEGDSGPIIRSIALGPVDRALWMLPLGRLIVGTGGSETVPRSTSFDEVMTPDNFSIKDASNYGSADVAAVKVDRSGIFIEKSGKRAYVLAFSIDDQDYASSELTKYHPTILGTGNVSCIGVAVQRQPDTRLWFWLNDGTAIGLVYEPKEDVISWFRFETDGDIEDIAVLPNSEASDVYFVVNRSGTRFREKLAYDTNAWGGVDNRMADSYIAVDIVATDQVTGLTHLNGRTVIASVDGAPMLNGDNPRTFVVGGGTITLPQVYTGKAVVGLPYEGRWQSTKLAYGAQMGTAVSQMKTIKDFAAVLYKTHLRALKYGTDFDHMRFYSREVRGKIVPADTFLTTYDARPLDIDGTWDTDQRLCLLGRAPMSATIIGLAGAVLTHETG